MCWDRSANSLLCNNLHTIFHDGAKCVARNRHVHCKLQKKILFTLIRFSFFHSRCIGMLFFSYTCNFWIPFHEEFSMGIFILICTCVDGIFFNIFDYRCYIAYLTVKDSFYFMNINGCLGMIWKEKLKLNYFKCYLNINHFTNIRRTW